MKWSRRIVATLWIAVALIAPASTWTSGCDDYDCGPISTWST